MSRRMYQIFEESFRAPGLPYPSPRQSRITATGTTHYLPVVSINYDYLPMALESPKTFWVDLISPAPYDLLIGTPVKLHITPNRGIRTSLNSTSPWNSIFEITDIIGSRVILSPYRGSAWLPTVHSSCDNPFGWGYDMKMANVSTNMHNVKYGYGSPVSYLEYHPVYYSSRATQLQATQMEEDFYRGSRFTPGWHS